MKEAKATSTSLGLADPYLSRADVPLERKPHRTKLKKTDAFRPDH